MSKKPPLQQNDHPDAPRPSATLSEARAAAITKLVRDGYTAGDKQRPVESVEHAEFLARAGAIELPE